MRKQNVGLPVVDPTLNRSQTHCRIMKRRLTAAGKRSRTDVKCPRCQSAKVIPTIYGLPGEKLLERAAQRGTAPRRLLYRTDRRGTGGSNPPRSAAQSSQTAPVVKAAFIARRRSRALLTPDRLLRRSRRRRKLNMQCSSKKIALIT
jgi:hypothetical protein